MRTRSGRGRFGLALALAIAGAAVPAAPARAAVADAPSAGIAADGPVRALASAGATTFLGGDFTRVGTPTGPGALLGAGDGRVVSGAAQITGGDVLAAVADANGGWYVGGTFTHVGGTPRARLARLHADGTLDTTFAPRLPPGAVHGLALGPSDADAHVLYVAGSLPSPLLAVERTTGRSLPAWAPKIGDSAAPPVVLGLDVATVVVTAAGAAREVSVVAAPASSGGVTVVWGVDAVDAAGAAREGATVATVSPFGAARAAAFGPPKPIADGAALPLYYATASAVAAAEVTATGTATASQSAFDYADWSKPTLACEGEPPCVHALAVAGDRVYVGGDFTVPGEAGRARLLALAPVADADLGGTAAPAPPAVAAVPDGAVRALAVEGETLYAGGDFMTAVGARHERVAAWRVSDHALLPSFDGHLAGGDVFALAAAGERVYAGGSFSLGDAVERRGVAAVEGDRLLPFAPAIACDGACAGPRVHALATDGATVWAGGIFHRAGGVERRNLAAFDAATGTVRDFRADATGPAPGVLALGLSGGTLFVGGGFEEIGGAPRANLAALDPATGQPRAWRADADAVVHAVLPTCGVVYAGGGFRSLGGAPRDRIGAVDQASGGVLPWDPGASSAVSALARVGGTVYAGGAFTQIGGALRAGLAALDASTGRATAWAPAADGTVRALAAGPEVVYAGGSFDRIGSEPRSRLAAIDVASGDVLDWAPLAGDRVWALHASADALVAGGDFRTIGRTAQHGLAQFAGEHGVPAAPRCAGDEKTPAAPQPTVASPPTETAPPTNPGAIAKTARLILRARILRRRGRRVVLAIELSAPARVTVTVERRRRTRCGRRPCLRHKRVARVRRAAAKGTTRLRRTLRPGTYRIRVSARTATGETARPVTLTLRVPATRRR